MFLVFHRIGLINKAMILNRTEVYVKDPSLTPSLHNSNHWQQGGVMFLRVNVDSALGPKVLGIGTSSSAKNHFTTC